MPSVTPQTVHISPSSCHDLSLFKDIMREYRKLDDTIIMRLNRANANMRDQDRVVGTSQRTTVQDQACDYIWRELVANWNRRQQLMGYCIGVVDQSLSEKRTSERDASDDPRAQRRIQAEVYSEEVKRSQMHRELSVESIVEKRSVEAFRSRCKYFQPPKTDVEARRMWDNASK